MIVLVILFVCLMVGVLVMLSVCSYSSWHAFGVFMTLLSGILLIMVIIVIPIERMGTLSQIKEFEATKATYKAAMVNPNTLENATIQLDIAKMNRWVASTQYWNTTCFDIWIPDEVNRLTPINLK